MSKPRKGVLIYLGAHDGGSLASLVHDFDRVVAFEAQPANIAKLKLQFGHLPHVTIVWAALTDTLEDGWITFHLSSNNVSSSLGTFKSDWLVDHKDLVMTNDIRVPSMNLRRYCQDAKIDVIDFYMSDIQGADLMVLKTMEDPYIKRGAIKSIQSETTKDGRKNIYSGLPSNELSSFRAFLEPHGYKLAATGWGVLQSGKFDTVPDDYWELDTMWEWVGETKTLLSLENKNDGLDQKSIAACYNPEKNQEKNQQAFQAWVVNLDRRPDRLQTFEKCAESVGLKFERLSATNGQTLTLLSPEVKYFNHKSLRKSEIGCASSEVRLWRKLVEDPIYNNYIIIDDDVYLLPGFTDRANEALKKLNTVTKDWNILWLGCLDSKYPKTKIEAETQAGAANAPVHIQPTGWDYYGGTWCYVISKKGAKQLLQAVEAFECNRSIDAWIAHMGPHVFSTFKCNPMLAWTEVATATTGDTDIQRDKRKLVDEKNDIKQNIMTPTTAAAAAAATATPDTMVEVTRPVAKTNVRVGLVKGAKWFQPFVAELFRLLKQPVVFLPCTTTNVDLVISSVFDEEIIADTSSAGAAACYPEIFICGEPRSSAKIDSILADENWSCCVTSQSTYLPQWVTSFFERKDHTLAEFRQAALLPKQPASKSEFCAFMYSNEVPGRNQFFDLLNKRSGGKVHALGSCRRNTNSPLDRQTYDLSTGTFYDLAVQRYEAYKFVIAFENTRLPGYVTEKLLNPMLCKRPVIIIYFGAPDVGKYFNTKSFINVVDYGSFDAAIEHVMKLDSSPELYNAMLAEPFLLPSQCTYSDLQPFASRLQIHLQPRRCKELGSKFPLVKADHKQNALACDIVAASTTAVVDKKSGEKKSEGSIDINIGGSSSRSSTLSGWTVVSALFDIPTDTGIKGPNRPIDFYLEYRFVLEMDHNLVMFCDPRTYPKLFAIRAKAGLLHKTFFIRMHMRDFPLYKYHDTIVANRRKPPVYDPNHRNTASYFILTTSKFFMLKRAIEINPFDTKFVAWCDFGLQHIGDGKQTNIQNINDAFALGRTKPSFCYIAYIPPRISQDPSQMYGFAEGRCSIACSFFTGENTNMVKLCNEIEKEFIKVVSLGHGHAEEQLLCTVHSRDPAAFDLFYGDYTEQLINYVTTRDNPGAILSFFIDRAIKEGDYPAAFDACDKLFVAATVKKTVHLDAEQLTFLCERYAYAAQKLNNTAVAAMVTEFVKTSKTLKDYFMLGIQRSVV